MSDDLIKVTVAEGKYTFGQRKDGACYALRYGEPWREDIFDGLTLAMAHHIEELESKLAKAVETLNALDATLDRNGWHVASIAREGIRITLAEIKGTSHE